MSGWNSWSIRRKLFAIIVGILICNVVILLVMGSTLFERFYQHSKISEITSSAKRIWSAYQQNSETIYEEISAIEYENVTVTLVSFDSGQEQAVQVLYHSRPGRFEEQPVPGEFPIPPKTEGENGWFGGLAHRLEQQILQMETNSAGHPVIYRNRDGKGDKNATINLLMCLDADEGLYLNIETPQGYIRSVANLAVRYTAIISILLLLGGAVIIYFVVGRVTRPLSSIQKVAGQISQLDFSERCKVSGNDEIASLARSVNNMADDLQASVDKLVSANEVLQNDLIRQQQTDRMRREFIANVSHDFKTPLTLIISYAEALAQGDSSEQDKEFCQIILSEGEKLSQMVGRLLELSKMENGAEELQCSMFCLDEIIDEVCTRQKLPAVQKGITVSQKREDAFIVYADYQKIERVVMNLFDNALKYTPQGGSILLETVNSQPGKCDIRIYNTGIQIADGDIDSLFDSFYRADKSRTGDRQSYGLGLAIVRAVMQAHGEEYGVFNTEDGVCFWVRLPLAQGIDEEPDA